MKMINSVIKIRINDTPTLPAILQTMANTPLSRELLGLQGWSVVNVSMENQSIKTDKDPNM